MERTIRMMLAISVVSVVAALPTQGGIVYYTAEKQGNFSHLYSYQTGVGTITDLGVLQGQTYTTDLAVHAGKLYGIAWANASASGTAKLFQITPGSVTERAEWSLETIHSNSMSRSANAAVFDADGNLFVASYYGDFQKLAYDASRDRWDVVKAGSLGAYSGGDLAFSADDSTLYATLAGGILAKVDFDAGSLTFGRATAIGSTGYAEVFGLAKMDGLLYGATNVSSNYGKSYLVQIDPLTGRGTTVADLGTGVWGAASGNGGEALTAVPEPVTLALVVLGAAALPIRSLSRSRQR